MYLCIRFLDLVWYSALVEPLIHDRLMVHVEILFLRLLGFWEVSLTDNKEMCW